jgi:hypothetical protein
MKLRQALTTLAVMLALFVLNTGATAQIWSESFETDGEGTNYVSSFTFNDGTSDHFGRTDGTDVSGAYSGFDGAFFWAAEDWDDNGGDLLTVKTLTFSAIDITGLSDLQFSGLFATELVATGWDSNDTLRVEYAVDGGAWTTLLTTAAPTGLSGSNIGMWMDTDDDNVGDVEITPAFQSISKSFSVSGTSLVIRAYADSPSVSGSESLAFDLFAVSNVAGAIPGCTDPTADNYDATATLDDGSCIISGCTNDTADNYNPNANNDDGSCIIQGCTDDTALNYNADATNDDGSCVFTVPAIVLNELHFNPCTDQGSDNLYEFIELFNNDVNAVDLSGWSIDGVDFTFPAMSSIAAGEYIIVAAAAATYDGNGYQVFQVTGGAFGNGGEPVSLLNDAGIVVDAFIYDTGTNFPDANGNCSSLELIDVNTDNAIGSNWQASFELNGTPGAANSTVPPFTEYTIAELQSELYTNEGVATSGVVTAVYGGSNLFTMQDGTGANSGIWVNGAGVAIGDEVEVEGVVLETNGLTQINAENIAVLTSGNVLPTVEVLSTFDASAEQWEGVLLQVTGTVGVGAGDLGFGEWSLDDSSGAVLVDDLGVVLTPVDEGITFRVTAPLYFSFGNFKLTPRNAGDVERFGCTDNTFPNFDPLATVDDGSCANIPGCTNPAATNFDPAATADDGSCIVEGCTDDTALNYDVTATTDDGSCYFTEPLIVINEIHYNPCFEQGDDGDFEFFELYNAEATSIDLSGFTVTGGPNMTFPEGASIAAGEYIVLAINPASYTGNGYQVFELFGALGNGGTDINLTDAFGNLIDQVIYDDGNGWPTLADGDCPSLELIDSLSDNSVAVSWQDSYVDNGTPGAVNSTPPAGCTDPLASNYDATALVDDGSCEFLGCTNPDALNYDANATTDDGSCELLGCTYEVASNYDVIATVDDGSCTFEINNCPADFNSDGFVNASDLLLFLGDFGNACD